MKTCKVRGLEMTLLKRPFTVIDTFKSLWKLSNHVG